MAGGGRVWEVVGGVMMVAWLVGSGVWAQQKGWELWRTVMFASSLFHALLNVATPALTRTVWRGFDALAPGEGRKADERDDWTNTLVSLVHSVLSSATCYPALLLHWREATSWGDLALYLPPQDEWSRVSAAITMGYLWVDVWDAMKTGLFVKKLSTVVSHHVMMFYGLWVVCENRWGEILIMYGVICELNSGFLHLRKLMSLAGYGFETPLYTVIYVLIAVSFVTTRYAAHAYVALRSWVDADLFVRANIPPIFRYLNTAAFLFLMLFNFGLHMQVQNNTLRRDLDRFRAAQAAKSS